MKVNKAPEKIYLFENPITKAPDDRWLSKRSDKNDIEYVRTDAFIEKAEGWLREVQKGFILTDKDITDFINFMK